MIAAAMPVAPTAPVDRPLEAPLRVLVVDDDADINRLIRLRLRARGYEVEAAANGAEGLAAIGWFAPDLMICDVSMPVMDGLALLDRVRGDGLDLAVMMATAFGSEKVAIEALRRGADDYLRKPLEPIEFQAVLDRTAARLRLTRENRRLQTQLDEKRHQ
ncbi:MAG: response regulator, partial [Chloroflexia bacterium]|nr:response regulator [Chloroflexia bacterium]